ncbi:IclR family transcriptional regulator [Peristeroidobacter soli]|jgi:DNA-binding IclR family transcriptional regulator|uniref:IclR family transcriptional regulator n=1 Tax=Peristeroidobacter soli TaxID=2497877 RepID=UPI00101CFC15|nr:IclR family transcriptional regulator [Peristeroidobacter soli]
MAQTSGGTTTVPAAARTLAVFEVFAREKRELLKSELARLLDLPESSCSDLLNTLHELGYVSRTVSTKRFYPTGRLIEIAKSIAEYDEVLMIGTEATALLSGQSSETCFFGEIDDTEVRIVAVSEGSHRLRYVVLPGDRVSIHATAIGKALLGGLDDEERDRVLRLKPLRALTEATKTSPEQLEKEIKAHQKLGYYQAVGEGRQGVSSFAVHGWIGPRLVGLAMVGPSDRFVSNKNAYLKQLKEAQQMVFEGKGLSAQSPAGSVVKRAAAGARARGAR